MRLGCIFRKRKIKVPPGPYPAADSPPDCRMKWFEPVEIKRKSRCFRICFYGAGDEARTRYLHLGKVALYRMSYTRGTS